MSKKNISFKSLIYIVFSAFLLFACQSATKMLEKGDYDGAIKKAAKKLHDKADNPRVVAVLKEAYTKANQKDLTRIDFLKKDNSGSNWDEIYILYTDIRDRQEIIKKLPPLKDADGSRLILPVSNYDDEIIASKKKATEYHYNAGIKLLQAGGKPNARKAYQEFNRCKGYYPDYKDVETQSERARELGISKVLFTVKNRSGFPIPEGFTNDLYRLNFADLNTKWVQYFTDQGQGRSYDYSVVVNIDRIAFSPESVKESRFEEKKDIEDGFSYKLDSKGNVMKDAQGNDIKIPKIRTISCVVIETMQHKEAHVDASIDCINNQTRHNVASKAIAADGVFDNYALVPIGDVKALSQQTKNKLGGSPGPFPDNYSLVMLAGNSLKGVIKNYMWNHCDYLQ